MARIIKRGDEYYVEFYGNGLLFQKFAGKDKKQAQKLLEEIKTSLPEGAMSRVIPDQGIDVFVEQYLQVARKRYSKRTYKQFESALHSFRRSLNKKYTRLSAITPKVIEQYRDTLVKRKKSSEDINFQIFLLGCILEFAIQRCFLNDNPTLHVRFLKAKEPKVLQAQQLKGYLKTPDAKVQLIVKFLMGEAALDERLKLLKWTDLNDEALKNTFIKKLLDSRVPLFKLYDIFGLDDIRALKPFTCWIPNVS